MRYFLHSAMTTPLAKHHDAILHILGVACPALCAVSLLDYSGLLSWTWILFAWLSCGHFVLYANDLYTRLKHHPFATCLFAFGVGLLWPVWLVQRLPRS